MKTFQRLTLAAAALCGTLLTLPAQAHEGQVQWAVRIGLPLPPLPPLPGLRIESAPVYASQPVYVEPAWRERPEYRHHPRWRADRDHDGVPDWRDGYDNRRDPPGWRHAPDRDRDGVPDWRERRYPYGR